MEAGGGVRWLPPGSASGGWSGRRRRRGDRGGRERPGSDRRSDRGGGAGGRPGEGARRSAPPASLGPRAPGGSVRRWWTPLPMEERRGSRRPNPGRRTGLPPGWLPRRWHRASWPLRPSPRGPAPTTGSSPCTAPAAVGRQGFAVRPSGHLVGPSYPWPARAARPGWRGPRESGWPGPAASSWRAPAVAGRGPLVSCRGPVRLLGCRPVARGRSASPGNELDGRRPFRSPAVGDRPMEE
jgi:hypothetical protein